VVAQSQIVVTTDHQYFEVPFFKEDSVQTFSNKLVKEKKIASIKKSLYAFEIRFYNLALARGSWILSIL
jgi:hypothetical protein